MYRTHARMMAEADRQSSWSDTPPEILSLIQNRLSSAIDRACFRAVCHPWRDSTLLFPPPSPPLPLIVFSDISCLYSFSDGATYYNLAFPEKAVGKGVRCRTSAYLHGSSWLVLTSGSVHGRYCYLLNPFSQATIPLPSSQSFNTQKYWPTFIVKLVVLPNGVAAAVIGWPQFIAVCWPGSTSSSWFRLEGNGWCPQDITVYQGKLYAVYNCGRVVAFEFDDNDIGKPKTHRWGPLHSQGWQYFLVESRSKLLMVQYVEQTFRVFELDPICNDTGMRFVEIKSLNGQALFVHRGCSRSFPVADSFQGLVKRDCIYFLDDTNMRQPFRDSGVYSVKDGTLIEKFSRNLAGFGPRSATWVFFS